jgi:hypothetical protein
MNIPGLSGTVRGGDGVDLRIAGAAACKQEKAHETREKSVEKVGT